MSRPRDNSDERTRSTVVRLPWAGSRPRVVAVWDGGHLARELPARGTLRIGRALDSEIAIDHSSVSRHHATLHVGDVLEIEDAGSSNGTFVHKRRLARGERVAIMPGDSVEVGAAMLLVQRPPEEAAPADGDTGPLTAVAAPSDLDAVLTTLARSHLDVVLMGETGVGKEVAAEEIHRRSQRAKGPLTKLNCAAMPEALLEAELFGYERGAFTGATQAKAGLLEATAGGTVVLDEVGEMPLTTQVKLLRAIENREVQRIGALRATKIDVRFVAATNRDLESEIAAGRFRMDLYFRLAGVVVRLPPLRERRDELPALATHLLGEACERAERAPMTLDASALTALAQYDFPGNVRELKRMLERAAAFAAGPTVRAADLSFDRIAGMAASVTPPAAEPSRPGEQLAAMQRDMDREQRERIERALVEARGNQTKAAERLGVSRRTLSTWLDQFGFPRPRKK